MPIIVRSDAANMSREVYEGSVSQLGAAVTTFPGFHAHYSWVDDDGGHVIEVWESHEAFDKWMNEVIAPAMGQMNIEVETEFQPIDTVILRQG